MKILTILAAMFLVSCITIDGVDYVPSAEASRVRTILSDPDSKCTDLGDVEAHSRLPLRSGKYLKNLLREEAVKLGANVVRIEAIDYSKSRASGTAFKCI